MSDICGGYSADSIRNYLVKSYVWAPGLCLFCFIPTEGSVDIQQHPVLFFPDVDSEVVSFAELDLLLGYFFHL